ncbi:hypothetical protein MUP56_02165, partial [Patescibacteria group bacterium]|nr:hypothetical protein [Patescibacteria group bacterium]
MQIFYVIKEDGQGAQIEIEGTVAVRELFPGGVEVTGLRSDVNQLSQRWKLVGIQTDTEGALIHNRSNVPPDTLITITDTSPIHRVAR